MAVEQEARGLRDQTVNSLRPLVVDLDGALMRSDLRMEAASALFNRDPLSFIAKGLRRAPSAHFPEQPTINPASLPYDDVVLGEVRAAAAKGRPVYLVSKGDPAVVSSIAAHLGLFKGWFASDATTTLVGEARASRLVQEFGEGGFDYIGSGRADLPVWHRAATAISVRAGRRLEHRLASTEPDHRILVSSRWDWRVWLKQLRVHQYAKNGLVFVPLLTAHAFTVRDLLTSGLAFVAFCLCASAIYIINDMVDLAADRAHPTKRRRPLASGAISPWHALLASGLLLTGAFTIAATISIPFALVLLAYLVLTTAYSFWLKRKLLADVIALSLLYSLRVVAGAVAIDVALSEWLLAFSMLIFTSLALIKRYTELAKLLAANLPDPVNRNYRATDLSVIAAMAAAAGFNAVTVFALYVSSDTVKFLYSRPWVLWLICPVLLYWIGRALVLAHRQVMDDDPIVFALRDRISFLTIGVIVMLTIAAI